MKCRSCGPVFSTLWASESRQEKINLHVPVDLTNVDLSQVKKIYFAGGEPLLNSQHYDVLQLLIDQHIDPVLMYSTNFSVMSYRQHSVRDLWPKFREIHVHVSIDAIGQYAEFVRSGTIWKDIENNIEWLRSQPNCFIRISTVISAVNIWFLHSLFAYFDWLELPHAFEPILVNSDALIGLSSIPMIYRPPLIDLLKGSRWSTHVNIIKAIDVLEQNNYNQDKWYKFFMQQLILDQYRDESWFWQLPIRHNIYQDMFSWTN